MLFGNPVTDFYPVVDNLDGLSTPTPRAIHVFDAVSKPDEKYRRVQLGENGHSVLQSIADQGLYICPICYGKDKIEIPLQRDHNNDYLCNSCETPFRSNPDWRPPTRVRPLNQ